jgi:hypothetical protein
MQIRSAFAVYNCEFVGGKNVDWRERAIDLNGFSFMRIERTI